MAVIDNGIRSMQEKGMHTETQNVLRKDDVVQLFKSESLSKNILVGFQARIVF